MSAWCTFSCFVCLVFFFKQKTAYEMRISDWSSDVCSSDLVPAALPRPDAAPVMSMIFPSKSPTTRSPLFPVDRQRQIRIDRYHPQHGILPDLAAKMPETSIVMGGTDEMG